MLPAKSIGPRQDDSLRQKWHVMLHSDAAALCEELRKTPTRRETTQSMKERLVQRRPVFLRGLG
jgi:hypothetical protein